MKFSDIFYTILIFLLYVLVILSSIISRGLNEVKNNWPVYRCNPMVMPFAGYFGYDSMENFTFCVGDIQKGMMEYFLQPINYLLTMAGHLGSSLMGTVQKIRLFFKKIRDSISGVLQNIFGIFVNVILQFQKMVIKIKDMILKLSGVVVTILYMFQAAVFTGQSMYKGPIVGALKALCFSPNTPVKLNNGKVVSMKNLKIGDVLENNSHVIGTLRLKGSKHNCYYEIWSEDLGEFIYVTGQHKMFPRKVDPSIEKHILDFYDYYIPVSEYKNAKLTNKYDQEMCCLITDDHTIPIGEYSFWDWED